MNQNQHAITINHKEWQAQFPWDVTLCATWNQYYNYLPISYPITLAASWYWKLFLFQITGIFPSRRVVLWCSLSHLIGFWIANDHNSTEVKKRNAPKTITKPQILNIWTGCKLLVQILLTKLTRLHFYAPNISLPLCLQ